MYWVLLAFLHKCCYYMHLVVDSELSSSMLLATKWWPHFCSPQVDLDKDISFELLEDFC